MSHSLIRLRAKIKLTLLTAAINFEILIENVEEYVGYRFMIGNISRSGGKGLSINRDSVEFYHRTCLHLLDK